jgi:Ca-activated chloride channel family protein
MKAVHLLAVSAPVCFAVALWAQEAAKTPQTPPAQTTPAADQETQTTFTFDVTRVNVLFTVTDKKGRFVTDLGKGDFSIVEGKKPQVIQQFTAESDLPLRIAVLVDTSNSIREQFRFEQEAAIRFLQSVVRPKEDRVMLVSFDSAAELVCDLTGDMKKLEAGIKGMRPGGGTSLYDAIYFASKEKLITIMARRNLSRG